MRLGRHKSLAHPVSKRPPCHARIARSVGGERACGIVTSNDMIDRHGIAALFQEGRRLRDNIISFGSAPPLEKKMTLHFLSLSDGRQLLDTFFPSFFRSDCCDAAAAHLERIAPTHVSCSTTSPSCASCQHLQFAHGDSVPATNACP